MDRQAGALVLRRALQLVEYAVVGALVVISFGMAIWNAGKWLLGV